VEGTVYLKRLEIQGFKSFPSRTAFEFGPGVTAVIGPNGSGKSNVSDAIRWVLGEQNPRAMRLRKLDDALFAGGHKRAPAGFAEVSIWLDNTDGWLPLDFSEVVVTRRLHRSGDTDYLLNRQRVRLRDINELFLKARLGQNSYAIMGQGLVDQVLSLKPEERRALIEEAAEIRRYRIKIEEAQDRLAATQENLEKVDLLVAEIAPRLGQLERQARRAREHGQLTRELAEMLHAWYGQQWRARDEALVAARAVHDQRNAAFAGAQAELDQLEQRLVTVRERLAAEHHSEQAALEQLRRAEEDARAMEQRLRLEDERLVFVRRRLDDLEVELRALEAERAEIEQPGEGTHDDISDTDLEAAQAAVTAHQSELAAFDAEQGGAQRRGADAENTLRQRRGQMRDIEERLVRAERELARAEQETPSLAERRRALLERLAEIGRRYLARLEALEQAEAEAKVSEREHSDALVELERARDHVAALERALAALRAGIEEQTRRYELLERMRDQHRGMDGAVRVLRDESVRAGRPSILGLLGELLRVPRGMEVAIEAALSEYVTAVVVPEQRDAMAALRALYEQPAGRATVVPLDRLRPAHALNLANEKGVVGVASRFVKCDARYRDLVDTLLGRFIIVEDIETGQSILRRGLGTVVTIDGIVMRPNGTLTGGRTSAEGGRFSLDRELAEIPGLIERALAEQEQGETELAAAQRNAEAWRAHVNECGATAEHSRRVVGRARETLLAERAALAPVRGDLRYLHRTAERTAQQTEELQAEIRELHGRLRTDQAHVTEAESTAAALRKAAQDAAARREELMRVVADARGTLAALEREQQAIAAMRESRWAALLRLEERSAARAREADARRREIGEAEADCNRLREQIAASAEQRARAESEAAPARDRVRTLAREVEELEPLQVMRRRGIADLERACLNAEGDVHRRAQECERLRDEMAAEGIEPGTLEAAPPSGGHHRVRAVMGGADDVVTETLTSDDPATVQERIRGLRARIRNLGPINAQAEADYHESKERHDFLTAQVADLQGAEAGLREALDDLRRLVRERFRESFHRVGADFQEYFKTFFGGGTARLVLTEPEDYGESGVDIIARPPGKRLQSLSLLSGGERSMTAVALLFALLQSNPAPFCVLDEVDAALDESNVSRFGDALKGLAERTQFIVITHNRLTIESADTIYGVSMGGDGASSVLSLRLADIPE
jgi:chromosome segregation protein